MTGGPTVPHRTNGQESGRADGKVKEMIISVRNMSGLAGFALAKGLTRGLSRYPNPSLRTFGTTQLRLLRGSIIAWHYQMRSGVTMQYASENKATPNRRVVLEGDSPRRGGASSRSYIACG